MPIWPPECRTSGSCPAIGLSIFVPWAERWRAMTGTRRHRRGPVNVSGEATRRLHALYRFLRIGTTFSP